MDIKKILKKIGELKNRTESGRYTNLTSKQKKFYDCLKNLFIEIQKSKLKRNYIKERCLPQVDIDNRETFISDFCYNKVNLEDNKNKFLLSPEKGFFRFVDFNWNINELVEMTWYIKAFKKSFKVGTYKNRVFDWNFKELEDYIHSNDRP